ncbi:carbohydrate ABC transporter permease [Thermoplasma sp.]|uniref:carbohydrate ABC transporter permease n=1 Tax=Thermoplasma sp. TaxID=1973142 RepID=UPI002637FC29|nr:sugar ABC transporter permease [Thermoplasma sp.]
MKSMKTLNFSNFFNKSYDWKSIIYVIPVIAVLVFLDFYPIGVGVYFSFTNLNVIHFYNYSFIGFANYIAILTSSAFPQIILHTIIWSVGSTVLMVPMGFALALIINQKGLIGKRFYRTLILFPWAYPAFITLLIWKNMLSYHFGIINEVLNALGFKGLFWLGSPSLAMLSLILVNLWLSFPYYTYVFTASIQSIPSELYDAAEMDGYGTLRTLRRITLPMLSRQFAFITIFGFIFTWNNFYPVFLLTGGGPLISTQILITYSYYEAFTYLAYGVGIAYAIISILILLVLVVLANKYTKMMQVLY